MATATPKYTPSDKYRLHTCKTCGKEFWEFVSNTRTFCSKACIRDIWGTHRESYTRLHMIWCHMKSRCHCPTNAAYRYYGAKGVTVCEEWRNSFETFRDWALTNGYADDLELDRKDGRGGYSPGNCRWATRRQQCWNKGKRSSRTTSRFVGVSWCTHAGKWRAQIVRRDRTQCPHIGNFSSELQAALAYDDAAFALRGEFACLNFPERKKSQVVDMEQAGTRLDT